MIEGHKVTASHAAVFLSVEGHLEGVAHHVNGRHLFFGVHFFFALNAHLVGSVANLDLVDHVIDGLPKIRGTLHYVRAHLDAGIPLKVRLDEGNVAKLRVPRGLAGGDSCFALVLVSQTVDAVGKRAAQADRRRAVLGHLA